MALNPTPSGDSHNWNYSKPENDGFSTKLTGTVAAIQEVQAMNFGADGRPTTGKFWENSGQPVWNIRMVLVGPNGGFRTWTFTPASKAAKEGKKPSVHIDLFNLAGGKNILDLIGKTITIETEQPPAGFSYGIGNPRPWKVSLSDEGPYELKEELDPIYRMKQVLANGSVSGGVMQPPPTVNAPEQAAPDAQSPTMQDPAQAGQQPQQAPQAQPTTPAVDDDIPF